MSRLAACCAVLVRPDQGKYTLLETMARPRTVCPVGAVAMVSRGAVASGLAKTKVADRLTCWTVPIVAVRRAALKRPGLIPGS